MHTWRTFAGEQAVPITVVQRRNQKPKYVLLMGYSAYASTWYPAFHVRMCTRVDVFAIDSSSRSSATHKRVWILLFQIVDWILGPARSRLCRCHLPRTRLGRTRHAVVQRWQRYSQTAQLWRCSQLHSSFGAWTRLGQVCATCGALWSFGWRSFDDIKCITSNFSYSSSFF